MRHYEVVAVIHPDQQGRIAAMIELYQKIVTEGGGTMHRLEDWGRRALSYPIQNQHKAQYLLMNIECENDTLDKLREIFRFSDFILRSMIVRREQAITEISKIMQEKNAEKERIAEEIAENEARAAEHDTFSEDENANMNDFAVADAPLSDSAAEETYSQQLQNYLQDNSDSIRQQMIAEAQKNPDEGTVLSYSALCSSFSGNKSGQRFGKIMGNFLGKMGDTEHNQNRPLLPVVVVRQDKNMPGNGFFALANRSGFDISPNSTEDDKQKFVQEERQKVYLYWSKSDVAAAIPPEQDTSQSGTAATDKQQENKS